MSSKILLLMLLCFLLITSCSPRNVFNSEKEDLFVQMFPIEEMNTKIRFLPTESEFVIGECVDLLLKNTSRDIIAFSFDKDLIVLLYSEHQWMQVENTDRYYPKGRIPLLPDEPNKPGVIATPICPKFDNNDDPIEIRIVITGSINGNNGELRVGAFTDILLQP